MISAHHIALPGRFLIKINVDYTSSPRNTYVPSDKMLIYIQVLHFGSPGIVCAKDEIKHLRDWPKIYAYVLVIGAGGENGTWKFYRSEKD